MSIVIAGPSAAEATAPRWKLAVRRAIPFAARERVKQGWLLLRQLEARRALDRASAATAPLDATLLPELAREFPVRRGLDYEYDPDSLARRGAERARRLLPLAPRAGARFLEVGAADAMTACTLRRAGHEVTAVDIDVSRTDPRAAAAGVVLVERDATSLDIFPDAAFDVVYSYDTFEHLPHPDRTFREMCRVLRPGGRLVLHFSHLGWSAEGAHMYKAIGIPWVQVLFDRETVLDWLRARGIAAGFPWVNDWGIERFRDLFRSMSDRLPIVRYGEVVNRYHVGLITRFPAQFRRAPSLASLLVDAVDATFRRR